MVFYGLSVVRYTATASFVAHCVRACVCVTARATLPVATLSQAMPAVCFALPGAQTRGRKMDSFVEIFGFFGFAWQRPGLATTSFSFSQHVQCALCKVHFLVLQCGFFLDF